MPTSATRSFDPKQMETPVLHSLLLGAVAPRPIAFASTVDAEGRPNLSPFSFFNVFGSNPPIAIFSPARRVRGNTTKHTLDNVEAVAEVVINLVSFDMVQQMNLASAEYPQGVNEFVKAGLTPIPSEVVRPFRVKESPVQLECRVNQVIKLGTEGGAGNLIVAEVLRLHVREDVLDANGQIDQHRIDLVARLGGDWYCRASGAALFEVAKPTRIPGIGVDGLPESVRESTVLTGNDLGRLGNVEALPTEEEVAAFRETPKMQALLQWQKRNRHDVEKQLHQNAQMLLEENRVREAWMMLLALGE